MDTLLFTFANQPANLLPTLQEEDDTLARLLGPRAREGHFFLQRESYTSVEELARLIPEYRDDLVLFHFSGHAGRDRLEMGDGMAHGEGLAQLLAKCPRLQLVFLNGCSTQGLVDRFLEAGIPAVLATSAPVEDRRATFFCIKFYEALYRQENLTDAFEAAKGALTLAFRSENPPGFFRAIGSAAAKPSEPAWGLFCLEKNAPTLDWRLPIGAAGADTAAMLAGFKPNEILKNTLAEALAVHSRKLRDMLEEVKNPLSEVRPNDIRNEVILTLPAPLADPVRKLVMPNGGYDKPGEARLRQLLEAYGTGVEMLAFLMLAQLWDAYSADAQAFKLTENQRDSLAVLFEIKAEERGGFDFIPFIQAIREIFEEHEVKWFVAELDGLREIIQEDSRFTEAVRFLGGLRRQALVGKLDPNAAAWQCKPAEENLAYVYGKLAFMARYRLATILSIDVHKYRHKPEPEFSHTTRILHDILGAYELRPVPLKRFMDNRSILLIDSKTWEFMNLTPFVIDKHAFEARTELTNLFFFSHYHRASDTCFFRNLQKPADPLLAVNGSGEFKLIKEQLDEFARLLLQKNLAEL